MPQHAARNVLHPPVGATTAPNSPTGAAAAGPYPKTAAWGTLQQVMRRYQHPPPGVAILVADPPAARAVEDWMKAQAAAMAPKALPPAEEAIEEADDPAGQPAAGRTTRRKK